MNSSLMINGIKTEAAFSKRSVETVFLPLLEKVRARQKEMDTRMIVFLAAPPAAGKSTLAEFLMHLSAEIPGFPRMQAVGMDGFHHTAAYIACHTAERGGNVVPMQRIKGAPESFDVEKLRAALIRLRKEPLWFPVYDRGIHDVRAHALYVDAPVVLMEGNWLLLDDPAWQDLPHDYTVFLDAPEALLRGRLIGRRLSTGRTQDEAERLWKECDGPNGQLCRTRHRRADVTMYLNEDGEFYLQGE